MDLLFVALFQIEKAMGKRHLSKAAASSSSAFVATSTNRSRGEAAADDVPFAAALGEVFCGSDEDLQSNVGTSISSDSDDKSSSMGDDLDIPLSYRWIRHVQYWADGGPLTQGGK